ncbi:hypothetical protein [Fodinibius salinus]|nr:hypothetical protein [Fodinibius salinus]
MQLQNQDEFSDMGFLVDCIAATLAGGCPKPRSCLMEGRATCISML